LQVEQPRCCPCNGEGGFCCCCNIVSIVPIEEWFSSQPSLKLGEPSFGFTHQQWKWLWNDHHTQQFIASWSNQSTYYHQDLYGKQQFQSPVLGLQCWMMVPLCCYCCWCWCRERHFCCQ
jgi:hypothetical protein